MKTRVATITEMKMLNGEVCLAFNDPLARSIIAGQYLQVFDPDSSTLLPTLLHPCGNVPAQPFFCGEVERRWQPGMTLHVRGPRGNGFHLPPLARRVALAAFTLNTANRLIPLADAAIRQGAAVTLVTDLPVLDLPAEIELLPELELSQLKNWADYVAFILKPDQIEPARQALDFAPQIPHSLTVEIQVEVPMICDEVSACGVCGEQTTRGWRLACKDGPVFPLDVLLAGEPAHG